MRKDSLHRSRRVRRKQTALREINIEVSKFKMKGELRPYRSEDLRKAFRRYCGACGLCSSSVAWDLCRFTHRIPLKKGGEIHWENLLPICDDCRKAGPDRAAPLAPELRAFGFNALSDLIVHLVLSTVNKDEERIQYFKILVEQALRDYVMSLRYKTTVPVKEVDYTNVIKTLDDIPDIISGMSVLLQNHFQILRAKGKYEPVRDNESI